jgi:hypothetical protein
MEAAYGQYVVLGWGFVTCHGYVDQSMTIRYIILYHLLLAILVTTWDPLLLPHYPNQGRVVTT